jgi:hypothetical protein
MYDVLFVLWKLVWVIHIEVSSSLFYLLIKIIETVSCALFSGIATNKTTEECVSLKFLYLEVCSP